MKINRVTTLSFIFLILFVMMIYAIFGSSINLYSSVNSVSVMSANDADANADVVVSDNVDISDIAYGITDRIDYSSISDVAINIERVEVFKGMTIEELTSKLNKSLKGVLANQGYLVATRCIELGIDPYLAVAIMLHETGCNATCSRLARVNYNVGGMRGRSGWQKFDSIESGINGFLNNLYKNYYKKGLNTPEKMANKYAGGSTSWAGKIRNYMRSIEAK